jgi:vacuolar protein sorting-associated protein 13A/C
MFKAQLAKVLEQSVGQYVAGINSEALNLSIWSGKIELKNLSLKPEALDELHLPVVVERGTVGRIFVSVPWKSLSSEPVVIEIEDIELVSKKRDAWDWTRYAEEAEKSAADAKKAALELLELGRVQAAQFQEAHDDSGGGMAERMTTMILENLVIRISNIHIRFVEDKVMIAGMRLGSVNLETTNDSWKAGYFKKKAGGIAFKAIDLNGLSIYCDNPLLDDLENSWQRCLQMDAADEQAHDHILKPTSGRLLMQKTPAKMLKGGAPVQASLQFEEIAISLSSQQFNGFIEEAELFGKLLTEEARFKSNAHRPDEAIRDVLARDEPTRKAVVQAWWRFAGKAVIDQLRDLYLARTGYPSRYSWRTFQQTIHERRKYINLWKRTQDGVTWLPKLTEPEKEELVGMEATFLNQSIIQYRAWGAGEVDAEKKKLGQAKANAGWFSWGGSESQDAKAVTLTAEEIAELHKAIDETEVVDLSGGADGASQDPNAQVLAVSAQLPCFTVSLAAAPLAHKRGAVGGAVRNEDLVKLTLGGEYR